MGFWGKIAGAAKKWMKSYGSFRSSRDVEKMFRQGQVLPELAYYRFGPGSVPQAILALERRLTLVSRFWKPLDPNGAGLAATVDAMGRQRVESVSLGGWRILDPSGEVIGVAYGDRPRAVQVHEDGTVAVHPPEPDRPRPGR